MVASLAMAVLLVVLAGDTASWIAASAWQRAARCFGCIVAGAGVYFATLLLLGVRYADLIPGHRPPRRKDWAGG